MRMILATVCVAALLAAALLGLKVAERAWRRQTDAAVVRLLAAARVGRPEAGAHFDERSVDGAPPVVARYLRLAIPDGARSVRSVRLLHAGVFNMGGVGESAMWRRFASVQTATTDPPGFVWDAAIPMTSLRPWPLSLPVLVRDRLLVETEQAAAGEMRAAVLGLVRVANDNGPHIAQAALERWLAEAVWTPTLLAPGKRLRWESLGEFSALAVATAGDLTASVEFHFDPATGLPERVFVPARLRSAKTGPVPTPWEGRFSDYAERGGMLIPLKGEVAWLTEEGRLTYWQGEVVEAEYDFGVSP